VSNQTPTSADAGNPLLRHLLVLAERAVQQRDPRSAEQLYMSVLASEPGHVGALRFVVGRALEAKDGARARALTEQALKHASAPELHFLHGQVLEASADRVAAHAAFSQAVEQAPLWLPALLWKAAQEEALGQIDDCIRTSNRALHAAERAGLLETPERLPVEIRQRLSRAFSIVDGRREADIAAVLAPLSARYGAAAIARVEQALETSFGSREIVWPHPLQRPTFMFFPGLEPRPWFEREEFPFLDEIERHTAAIREELLGVMADASVLSPYIDMPAEAPAAPIWQELNRSTRWSSYHLFRHGERVEAHCQRCPRTAAALESIPLMRIPDHSPEALLSILKAGTHIPPHTGVINGRLTVHLPLVVPPDCGALKAGGEARGWQEGRCLIFDDSFVHEAWNHSGQDRAVLIFDIWDPRLSQAEREAAAAAIDAIGRFNRTYGDSDPSQNTH
jgi:aspartyl/asparaginyl beta-hydroxylase (cupin superfamily)